MSPHDAVPAKAEPGSLDDLVADGEVVRHLLDLRMPDLPAQRDTVRLPDRGAPAGAGSPIPESAQAVVAGLDAYGD